MPFDWLHSPPVPLLKPDEAFADQFRRAVRERARLLFNLRFDEATAVARIQGALDWEFDQSIRSAPRPALYAEVPVLVGEIYQRHASEWK